SWAARVLFGAITSVGRWSFSIIHAVVADLPVPVAPSRTTSFSPASMRLASSAMAAGWSPLGWYALTTSKGASVRSMLETGRMGSTVRPATDNAVRSAVLRGAGAASAGLPDRAERQAVGRVVDGGVGRDTRLVLHEGPVGLAHDHQRVE